MKLKIAICDDEEFFLEKIKRQVENKLQHMIWQEYIIDTFSSGGELYEKIENHVDYDIYLLDINMLPIGGLEIARKIRQTNKDAFIAFITGYIDYAMEGYHVDAIRYILKDSLDEMLDECMDVIVQRIRQKNKCIWLHFMEGDRKIYLDHIVYIESNKHKLLYHVELPTKEVYTMYEKLDSISQQIETNGFLRIHKSYLVNMKYIHKMQKYEVTMSNGMVLPIPREKYKLVEQKYYEYEGEML